MIEPEVRARIRRLYYAEHWKVGTIAAELSLHHDTVRAALAQVQVKSLDRSTLKPSVLAPYKDFIQHTLQAPSALSRNDPPMLSKRGPEGDHAERA
jgi:hypothetical protein